jgi:YggT family protein
MPQAVIPALRSVILLMECIILIRVLFEFMAIKRDSAPMRFIIQVSEPLLLPVRKLLDRGAHGRRQRMDLSPIVVMIILYLINRLLG